MAAALDGSSTARLPARRRSAGAEPLHDLVERVQALVDRCHGRILARRTRLGVATGRKAVLDTRRKARRERLDLLDCGVQRGQDLAAYLSLERVRPDEALVDLDGETEHVTPEACPGILRWGRRPTPAACDHAEDALAGPRMGNRHRLARPLDRPPRLLDGLDGTEQASMEQGYGARGPPPPKWHPLAGDELARTREPLPRRRGSRREEHGAPDRRPDDHDGEQDEEEDDEFHQRESLRPDGSGSEARASRARSGGAARSGASRGRAARGGGAGPLRAGRAGVEPLGEAASRAAREPSLPG